MNKSNLGELHCSKDMSITSFNPTKPEILLVSGEFQRVGLSLNNPIFRILEAAALYHRWSLLTCSFDSFTVDRHNLNLTAQGQSTPVGNFQVHQVFHVR